MPVVIEAEDPRAADVVALLEAHLAFSRSVTPPQYVFALDLRGLLDPSVTFFTARDDGVLVGVAAIKELDPAHGELKSMHTAAAARRRGVGLAMVQRLLAAARDRGYQRVSLETGTEAAYAAARALYSVAGFRPSGPFGDYVATAHNTFMSVELRHAASAVAPEPGSDGRSAAG